MTLSEQIQSWFKEKGNYKEGVQLLQQTGTKTQTFQRYMKAKSVPPTIKAKLRTKLEAYLKKNPVKKKAYKPKAAPAPPPDPTEPPAIQQLREKAILLHKQQAAVHTEMRISALKGGTNEIIAYHLAKKLMEDIVPHLTKIYNNIRHWKATGELPAVVDTDDIVQETVKKMLRRESLKSRLSRLKGKLKTAKGEQRQKYEKEFAEKEVELAEINQKYGLDGK